MAAPPEQEIRTGLMAWVASRAPPTEGVGVEPAMHPWRVTTNERAASYRRYNACCNENRFEDLARVRCARREARRRRPGTGCLRRRATSRCTRVPRLWMGVAPPRGRRAVDRRARHPRREHTARHSEAARRPAALSPSRSSPSTASMLAGLPRCGARPSTCVSLSSSGSGCRHRRRRIPLRPAKHEQPRNRSSRSLRAVRSGRPFHIGW
jgi:hypothetical protein